MNFENFTIKAQEAVQKAVDRATGGGQQAVTALHLLYGVMAVGENVTKFLFGKTGVNDTQVRSAVESELQHLPRVQGGEPYLDRDANEALLKAQDIARGDGDTYVGLEPILLALLEGKGTAAQILKDAGLTADALSRSCAAGRRLPRSPARTRTRRCRNTPATWSKKPAKASSTPSSAATRKYAACCRSCPGAQRTTPSSSANRAPARRR